MISANCICLLSLRAARLKEYYTRYVLLARCCKKESKACSVLSSVIFVIYLIVSVFFLTRAWLILFVFCHIYAVACSGLVVGTTANAWLIRLISEMIRVDSDVIPHTLTHLLILFYFCIRSVFLFAQEQVRSWQLHHERWTYCVRRYADKIALCRRHS